VDSYRVGLVLPANPQSRLPLRLALWIFAAFQFLYMLTSTGRVRTADEYNTLYTTESLVLRGSTAVPQAVQLHNYYGRPDLQGQPRAAYPPGQAVLCTPWYALGYYVLSRFPGVPVNSRDFVFWFSSCLSSATFSALTVTFFFLLLIDIGISWRASLFATVLLGLATPIFGYSAYFFSEPLSAAILMGVALLVFGRRGQLVSVTAAALAGLILGLAAWVRPTNTLAIPIFATALLLRDGKSALRTAAVLCGCSGAGIAALLSRNWLLFGGTLDFGYPKFSDYGISTEVQFDTPLSVGLYGFLLSPGKSVFLFAPPLLLAIVGLRGLWKLDRGVAILATLFPLAYLSFFSRYSSWEGGYCVGPRYLVPSIAILCLALGPVLSTNSKLTKKIAWLVFALGATIQSITLTTSFLEDQAPRGRYYDASWHYRLGYSLIGQFYLFWNYLRSGQPARLGLGWDRWFVFLHLGGISSGTLAVFAFPMLAGLAISLAGLLRTMRSLESPASTFRGTHVPANLP
jgi:hypothetical protein